MRALLILAFLAAAPAYAQKILIEDGQRKRSTNSSRYSSGNEGRYSSSDNKSRFSSSDGISLRKERKVAIGASAAGPLGMFGANLELNFNPRWGIMGGFGTGISYQTWTIQVKRVLAGENLLPYLAGGLSRWYTATPSKGPVSDDIQPAFLNQFLSDSEKEAGEFSQVLLYPAFGLQYMQLNGDYAGLSVFAEICLLLDVGDFEAAPTGTLGMLYYF